MNEKTHYDNLERLAKRRSVDDLTEHVQFYADRLNDELFQEKYSRANLTEYMAELYNALDLLCIHFDCADMVQDMAEICAACRRGAEQYGNRAAPRRPSCPENRR